MPRAILANPRTQIDANLQENNAATAVLAPGLSDHGKVGSSHRSVTDFYVIQVRKYGPVRAPLPFHTYANSPHVIQTQCHRSFVIFDHIIDIQHADTYRNPVGQRTAISQGKGPDVIAIDLQTVGPIRPKQALLPRQTVPRWLLTTPPY